MRRLVATVVFAIAVMVAGTAPASADGCKACTGYYDPVAARVELDCIRAVDDQMGWLGCKVLCGDSSCQCIQEGPPIYCMTIFVNG
jgi:hypothetical protein